MSISLVGREKQEQEEGCKDGRMGRKGTRRPGCSPKGLYNQGGAEGRPTLRGLQQAEKYIQSLVHKHFILITGDKQFSGSQETKHEN